MATRIRLDLSGINEVLNSPGGPVVRMVNTRERQVTQLARRYCPKDTGSMASMIAGSTDIQPFRQVKAEVSSRHPASWWRNRGTGIHNRDGSRGRIRPRTAKALRFPNRRGARVDPTHRRADAGWIFAASVEGQEANEFMWRALVMGTSRTVQVWTVIKRVP